MVIFLEASGLRFAGGHAIDFCYFSMHEVYKVTF